ncbi:MAG: flavin oxidoreductase/NADH oxidase [Candidatus Fimenecus sp.]
MITLRILFRCGMMMIHEAIQIHSKTAHNRVVFQPMEGCDGTADGNLDALTKRRYMRFAVSGAGIIWFEATAVCRDGRANPRQLYLTEENVDTYKALLQNMRDTALQKFGYTPLIILQATHSGRYSKPNGVPEPIIAYRNEVFEKGKENLPYRIISDAECDELPARFAETARLAAEAGFDGVDVKCCHGYLLNEFLSAYSRAGKYGGSFENRTRLYFRCIDAVKNTLPEDMFVTTRLSAYDGFPYPYGFGTSENAEKDLTETKIILAELQKRNVDLVNITIGNPYLLPHINRPYTGGPESGEIGVKRVTDITGELQKAFPALKLVLSALSFKGTEAVNFAEACLENGTCSLVGFGRITFAYPDFYRDFSAYGKLDANKVCVKCGNCSKMMRAGGVAGCPVRDKEVYLPLFQKYIGK